MAQERHGPYKIHKFVDGDTFWVKMENGKTEKIRLIGVDTPEVRWEGLTEEQPGGKEASESLMKGPWPYKNSQISRRNTFGLKSVLHYK